MNALFMQKKLLELHLLVYAYNTSDPSHAQAKRWCEALLNGTDPVGLSLGNVLRLPVPHQPAACPCRSHVISESHGASACMAGLLFIVDR